MNQPIPFDLPAATAFYVSIYVVTLIVHVVFMNYVLAGSAYLAYLSLWPKAGQDDNAVARTLRDWMPFAISAAITAGVAPLLFIQILYKERFYTANLLLFHRWMAIVPVLIVGFYLTYIIKSKRTANLPAWLRIVAGLGAFACFAFTAVSWTENHLLSMADQPTWTTFYAADTIVYRNAQLFPRLGIWFAGAFPTMAMLLSWQLQRNDATTTPRDVRRLAIMALGGAAIAGAAAMTYFNTIDPAVRDLAVTGPTGRLWLGIAIVGMVLCVAAWIIIARAGRLTPRALIAVTIGTLAGITGMTWVREAMRLAVIDLQALADYHAQASRMGGQVVFLLFFLINAGLIAWVLRMVGRDRSPSSGA